MEYIIDSSLEYSTVRTIGVYHATFAVNILFHYMTSSMTGQDEPNPTV